MANTCSWWVSVTPNQTGGWYKYPTLNVSPDGTKVALVGGIHAFSVSAFSMKRDGGGAATSYTHPRSGSTYYNAYALILNASDGSPVPGGVVSGCYQATPGGYGWEAYTLTGTWSPDSAYFTTVVATSEGVGQTWGYWNGTAFSDKVTFYFGFAAGAGTVSGTLILPAGGNLITAPWGFERITPSILQKDAAYFGAAQFAGDGNLWTVMNTYKQGSTGETTTYTYGGATVTTNAYAVSQLGTFIIFRGRIDPATSMYATSSVTAYKTTTSDSVGRQIFNVFDDVAIGPYPFANSSSMRMVFDTSIGSITFNGIACTGLTAGQSRAVTMDIAKDMTTTNFKTITANVAYVGGEMMSGQLLRGPPSDGSYSLVIGATYGWKGGATGT